jgi:DNA-binding NarL/FixJ family response regulator
MSPHPRWIRLADETPRGRRGLFAGGQVPPLPRSGVHLFTAVAETDPDLIVLDVRMPPTFTDEGMRAAVQIKREHPDTGVLVLSQHIERPTPSNSSRSSFGYLLKDRVLEVTEFLASAQRVADGGSALDPNVVAALLSAGGQDDPLTTLSERERAVLTLMAEGLTNTGIAQRLFVSERTIEGHVRHIMIKLDLPDDTTAHRRVLAVLAHLHAATR